MHTCPHLSNAFQIPIRCWTECGRPASARSVGRPTRLVLLDCTGGRNSRLAAAHIFRLLLLSTLQQIAQACNVVSSSIPHNEVTQSVLTPGFLAEPSPLASPAKQACGHITVWENKHRYLVLAKPVDNLRSWGLLQVGNPAAHE